MKDNEKYLSALALFRDTELPRKEICKRCHLTVGEFNAFLQRHHRDLLMKKKNIDLSVGEAEKIKLRGKSGQSWVTECKYKEAIEACRSLEYIQYNLSEVARMFHLNPTALGNQLRAHFPQILSWRREEQERRGLLRFAHNKQQKTMSLLYEEAVRLFGNSELTLQQVAERCEVSFSGFRQHLLFYHKDLVDKRRQIVQSHIGNKRIGERTGNNTVHQPQKDTLKKYEAAMKLYVSTSLTLREIAEKTGVSYGGFCAHVRVWNRNLMLGRRGIFCTERVQWLDLTPYKNSQISLHRKYTDAVQMLRSTDRTTVEVAKHFHFSAETFRKYLQRHEPLLAKKNGMGYNEKGEQVLNRSLRKYGEAVAMFQHSDLPLVEIAARLGLVYNSLSSYLRRHYPEMVRDRKARKRKK